MSSFEGIWLPLVTPFRDGQLDLPAAQRLARHYAQAGVHGLVVCGTTGESATLDDDEKLRLLDAILDAVEGRCPVVMGVGSNNTRETLEALKALEDRPIAGLLVVTPYYSRPSQEGLRAHFTEIARNTRLPIILYNVPYRTGINLELATAQALCELSNIVAIKESGGNNLNQMMDLIRHTRLQVLSGEDHLIFTTLCLGGHGAIAAAAHIRPDLYVAMYEAVRSGAWQRGRELAYQLLPMSRALFSEPNPGPIKAALAHEGRLVEELRLPMVPVSADCRERVRAELARLRNDSA